MAAKKKHRRKRRERRERLFGEWYVKKVNAGLFFQVLQVFDAYIRPDTPRIDPYGQFLDEDAPGPDMEAVLHLENEIREMIRPPAGKGRGAAAKAAR